MYHGSKNVLITGGLGYLGGRIATHLASVAPEISLRLMTRRGEDRIPEWAQQFEIGRADLVSPSSLKALVSGIDTVIHLAAVDEVESLRNPELALRVNGNGTYSLLQACHAQGVARFVYVSTFHVYGPKARSPITEETPTRPVHPYAITHRLAEDLVNWYQHSYEMTTLILRLSNGYGFPADPWVQRWTLVFNDLCRQAVQNGEIRLRSRGTQHRDFISLTDVGRAIRHLLALPGSEWQDGLFNLGGECSMSILQVAQRIAAEYSQRFGKEIPITLGGAEEAQTAAPVRFSIDKLKRTGFLLAGNMSEEVAGTFELCGALPQPSNQVP